MEGIILAGGFGTRLRPRVKDVPKPIAEVGGRPFLCWLLDLLAHEGFRRIILAVGYGSGAIMEVLKSRHGSIELIYAVEDKPLGTGGAIRHAMSLLDPALPAFWIMNGDTISALSHQEMFAAHAATSAQMTLALAHVANVSRYGAAVVRDNRIVTFTSGGLPAAGLINSGTYLVNHSFLSTAHWPEAFSFERDFLPFMMDNIDIRCFKTYGWFLDIGVPEDFDRAQIEIPVKIRSLIV